MNFATLCLFGCIFLALAKDPRGSNKRNLVGYEDAIFAGLSSSVKTRESPLKFNYVGTDVRGTYDQKGGKFYPFDSGDYWIALSAGAIPKQRFYSVGYRLYVEGTRVCSLRRNDNAFTGNDTLSRDIIIPVKASESMYIGSRYTLYSDEGIQTSFGAFRLTGLLKNESVYFSAVLETDVYGLDFSEGDTLAFNKTLVNRGNAFDVNTGTFTAPRAGLYFLSLSIGTTTSFDQVDLTYDFSIRRRANVLGTLEKYSTMANDADTVSRAGLYPLLKGDVITIRSDKANPSVVSFARDLQTSFSGFEYNPEHFKPVGFSVARTTSWKGSVALNPIPFDTYLVNEGGYWNKEANVFVVPTTGVYYVTVTAGAEAAEAVDINILVNGEEEASLLSTSIDRNGREVLSRSAILSLYARDVMNLRAEKRTAFYSTSELQTSFTGILLFPITH